MLRAILFDLDDTLVVEDAAATAAFEATARVAGAEDPAAVAAAVRVRARELWRAAPVHPYCLRVGISSSEGLWCRFEGGGEEIAWLREWAPAYRRQAWAAADPEQAEALGERFGVERRARHENLPHAEDVLRDIGADHALALVTNGASCLQREKLDASGLAPHFRAVVISGDLGVGKPDPAPFRRALEQLGCAPHEAVMVGDSLERDVEGALAAGLDAVWLNDTPLTALPARLRES